MTIIIGSTSFDTTADQDAGLQLAVDNANAARPLDGDGNPIGSEQTPESYLTSRVSDVLNSYALQNRDVTIAAVVDAMKSDPSKLAAAVAATAVVIAPGGGGKIGHL